MCAFVVVVLLSGSVLAQTPASTTQMQLASSPLFLARATYNGWLVAKEVTEEPHNGAAASPDPYDTNCHALRVIYAKKFIEQPAEFAKTSSVGVVSANYSGAVIVGTVTGTTPNFDSSATDGQVQQAYRFIWSALAGCDTGS